MMTRIELYIRWFIAIGGTMVMMIVVGLLINAVLKAAGLGGI